jgi:hypothetical protein
MLASFDIASLSNVQIDIAGAGAMLNESSLHWWGAYMCVTTRIANIALKKERRTVACNIRSFFRA